jgi:hypothetical protein
LGFSTRYQFYSDSKKKILKPVFSLLTPKYYADVVQPNLVLCLRDL